MKVFPPARRSSFSPVLLHVTRTLFIGLLAAIILLTACGASRNSSPSGKEEAGKDKVNPYSNFYVDFMPTDILSDALARAKAENKMVFIDFYTTWCLPCKLMDEDVFTDKSLGDYMNANFVSLKINAEQGNGINLAAMYEVKAFPTLLFVDINGRVKSRKEGAAYQTELKKLGEQAKASLP